VGFQVFHSLSSVFGIPSIVVIKFHLHDLFPSHEFDHLPLKWEFIYSICGQRNRSLGIADLRRLVKFMKARGYVFKKLFDLCHEMREAAAYPGLEQKSGRKTGIWL